MWVTVFNNKTYNSNFLNVYLERTVHFDVYFSKSTSVSQALVFDCSSTTKVLKTIKILNKGHEKRYKTGQDERPGMDKWGGGEAKFLDGVVLRWTGKTTRKRKRQSAMSVAVLIRVVVGFFFKKTVSVNGMEVQQCRDQNTVSCRELCWSKLRGGLNVCKVLQCLLNPLCSLYMWEKHRKNIKWTYWTSH